MIHSASFLGALAVGVVFFFAVHTLFKPALDKHYPPCEEQPWRPVLKLLADAGFAFAAIPVCFLGFAITFIVILGHLRLFL